MPISAILFFNKFRASRLCRIQAYFDGFVKKKTPLYYHGVIIKR